MKRTLKWLLSLWQRTGKERTVFCLFSDKAGITGRGLGTQQDLSSALAYYMIRNATTYQAVKQAVRFTDAVTAGKVKGISEKDIRQIGKRA